jgi:hypothetical protein
MSTIFHCCPKIFINTLNILESINYLGNAVLIILQTDWKQLTLERFHRYLSQNGTSEKILMELEGNARKVLGTGHEVMLTKKLHDIVDELRMMSRIFLLQKQVTNDFAEHLSNIYEQEQKTAEKHSINLELLDVMREVKELLKEKSGTPGSRQTNLPILAKDTHLGAYDGQERPPMFSKSNILTSTIERANRVSLNISKRRGELEELENTADMLSGQVCDSLPAYNASRGP